MKDLTFIRPVRPVIGVPHYFLDDTIETEQGKEQTIATIYQDFVLGRLDPSQIGGDANYDPEGFDGIDPFNRFGVTLEETTDLAERGREAAEQVRSEVKKKRSEARKAAEASARKKLEDEIRASVRAEEAVRTKE